MENDSTVKKALPCRFCDRHFRRLEHVQRHERTHTKETPFKCPCGRAFSRRDLLRRHEKSAHGGRSGSEIKLKNKTSSEPADPAPRRHERSKSRESPRTQSYDAHPRLNPRASQSDVTPAGAVEGFVIGQLDAATLSSVMEDDLDLCLNTTTETQPTLPNHAVASTDTSPMLALDQMNQNTTEPELDFADLYGNFDGFDAFLDMTDYSTLIPGDFNFDLNPPTFSRMPEQALDLYIEPSQPQSRNEPDATFSRFGSPLPTLQDEPRGVHSRKTDHTEPPQRCTPCWKISEQQYSQVMSKIEEFTGVLPKDFTPLSRHTMSRYLEGSIKGLCDHLPFIHIPTFSVAEAAPELILALAAIGAQFRFEEHRAPMLFYAAKAVIVAQMQLREKDKIQDFLSRPSSVFLGSGSRSDTSLGVMEQRSKDGRSLDERGYGQHGGDSSSTSELQTAQAIIALLVMGAWGPQQLVREAISLQAVAATLARNDGLSGLQHEQGQQEPGASKTRPSSWMEWIEYEREKRTRLMIYCMLNLMSVAYHIPPLIFTSEIHCSLPGSAREWNAKTPQEWEEARRSSSISEADFQESFDSQFLHGQTPDTSVRLSPLANYTLILALLQHIFLRRQTSAGRKNALEAEDIADISGALRCWQERWERSPESSIDPTTATGPVAFNSTALLRLAWIRLYADLGPCRYLASRDVSLIVSAFAKCPPLERTTAGLMHPVLQAAHALSIPVRMGINYVAKTQTVSWSVQHSISNLECAIFLSKWLEQVAVASATQRLEKEEQRIVGMIHSLLLETGLFGDDWVGDLADRKDQKTKIRQLATAVARMWAEIFKGTHVFEVVNTIGASMTAYAGSMESAYTPMDG